MAQQMVYGCDWCHQIVPVRSHSGKETPAFAAKITMESGELGTKSYDICQGCSQVFKAITEGKFRR